MADDNSITRTYRYRIYPTVRLRLALEAQLGFACQLYNAALEHMNCSAMRDPLRRLDRAFVAFFRGVKTGAKPGYPRFRSVRRYDSLTWDSGWGLHDGRLALQGIGQVKVKWHRPLPASAVVRTVTVRRVAERWYTCFSTGEQIPGPRAYRAAMRQLRVAQWRLARRRRGSHRRRRAQLLLARHHERIRNLRHDQAHKLTRRLVSDFGLIAVEDLNFGGLARGPLARDVIDQGWAAFLTMLEYKAAEAGTRLVKVRPGERRRPAQAAGLWSRICSQSGLIGAPHVGSSSTAIRTRPSTFSGSA